jgi:hypothetical protein
VKENCGLRFLHESKLDRVLYAPFTFLELSHIEANPGTLFTLLDPARSKESSEWLTFVPGQTFASMQHDLTMSPVSKL